MDSLSTTEQVRRIDKVGTEKTKVVDSVDDENLKVCSRVRKRENAKNH
jgi:hypothetical protein